MRRNPELPFDDTNPAGERQEFVDAALSDMEWLGLEVSGQVVYASHFFEQLYGVACKLIEAGHAYVCDLCPEELQEAPGDDHRPGEPSPSRDRSARFGGTEMFAHLSGH